MNKNVVFTICAKNYIGLAQVLEQSIKKFNKDVDFYIFVADEFIESDKLIFEDFNNKPDNILIAKDVLNLSNEKWNELSFKYNLTEFCTSIKSLCFSYVFQEKKYEKAIFLDPDILVFNSLNTIFGELEKYSIILTPHLLNVSKTASNRFRDNDMMNTGVFNLGFVALKQNDTSHKMLKWWDERLMDCCYIDYFSGYFTDQKWMNFIPGYFNQNEVLISNHLGMNVAPWNFEERKVIVKDNSYYISCRIDGKELFPLIFVHYSGFNYKELIEGNISHTTVNGLQIFDDLLPIFKDYQQVLKESDFNKYLKMIYSYNYFDNSFPISTIHRRLYRRLLADNKIGKNPFITKNPFYNLLDKQKMVSKESMVIDKSNRSNTTNIKGKIKFINIFLRFLYKVIGHEKYFMLVKLLREYSKPENHVHLIDKSYMDSNILSNK